MAPGALAQAQQEDRYNLAVLYQAVKDGKEVEPDLVEQGGTELAYLAHRTASMRMKDDVLHIRMGNNQELALCPPLWRAELVWTTHQQAHLGAAGVCRRLQLTWYWPGMVAQIRRILQTCEVCQAAKHG